MSWSSIRWCVCGMLAMFLSGRVEGAGMALKYASPICAADGGTTTMSCPSFHDFAIFDVSIERKIEGACGWTEETSLDCSANIFENTALTDAINIIFNRAYQCRSGDCSVELPRVETSCGDVGMIRIRYFCYTSSVIILNGGQVTSRGGCGEFKSVENLFVCPEQYQKVNIINLQLSYLDATTDCDGNTFQCELNYTRDAVWLNVQNDCRQNQICPLTALNGSDGILYGCTDFTLDNLSDVTYIYEYICQYPDMFDFPSPGLPVADSCIGMSDGLHAVVFDGRFQDNICWHSYTNCADESIVTRADVQTCEDEQGFDENTQLCQPLASRHCSVGVPELSALSLSSTEIQVSWEIDDVPFNFILTIDDPDYSTLPDIIPGTSRDYLFESLTPNKEYGFSLSALKGSFQSEFVNASNVTYPETPTGSATDIAMTSVTINYALDFTATNVLITINGNEIKEPVSANRFVFVDGLTGGTRYTATIALEGMTGLVSLEPHFSLSILTIPVPPENLSAGDVTETSIQLTWEQTGNSDRWLYYLDPQAQTSSNTPSVTVPSLVPGKLYEFFVVNVVEDLTSSAVALNEATVPHPVDSILFTPDTESVHVSWQHTVGEFESFDVTLFNSSGAQISDSNTENSDITFTDLVCGSTYSVRVVVESNGKVSSSVTESFTTLPVGPQTLDVTGFGTDFVNLTWSLTSCLSNYVLSQNDEENYTYAVTVSQTSLIDLTPGDTYQFEIKSTLLDHEGNVLSSTSNPTAVQTLIPLPPVDVTVKDYGSQTLTLQWQQPSDVYTGFFVQDIRVTAALEQTVEGLLPGSLQTFQIQTFSEGPDSTQNSTFVIVTQRLKPNPPTSFDVTIRGNLTATVEFSPPAIGEYSRFSFEAVSSDGTVVKNIPIEASGSETFFPEDIIAGILGDQINVTIFTFSEEERSQTAEIGLVNLLPADPVDFGIVGFSETELNSTWNIPPGLFGGHILTLKRLDAIEDDLTESVDDTTFSYSFTDLTPGGQYQVQLCVYSKFSATLTSANCAEEYQMLKPVPPTDLVVTPIDKTSVNVSWVQVGRFTNFEVSYPGNTVVQSEVFRVIDGLTPATDYDFSVRTLVSDTSNSVFSDSRSVTGWPYPDDVDLLTPSTSSSETGSVDVGLQWRLLAGGYDAFSFEFSSVPYADEAIQQTALNFTTEPVDATFSETFTETNISWFAPGMHVTYDATAMYKDLESQGVANGEFYIAPLVPVLEYLEGSRKETSLQLQWSFLIENALAESYILEYSNASDVNAFESVIDSLTFSALLEEVDGLVPGQLYDFRIRSAVNSETVLSDWSNIVSESTFPAVPQNASVTEAVLEWLPPLGVVQSYQVRVSDAFGSSRNQTLLVDVRELAIDANTDEHVAGRQYTFEIYSVSNGLFSISAQVVVYVIPPNSVTFVSVNPVSSTSCSLQWNIPDGDVDSYIITVTPLTAADAYSQNSVTVLGKSSNSVLVTGLTPGAEYKFEIVASSNGEVSEIPGEITAHKTPLLNPVQVIEETTNSAKCQWNSTGIVTRYFVFLLDADGVKEIEVLEVDPPVTEYDFTGLVPGSTYSCQVVAESGNVRSDPESALFALFPLEPDVEVSDFGTYTLTANWSVPDGEYDSFDVRVDQCRDRESVNQVTASTSLITWSDLNPGFVCRVRVWAISNSVYSENWGEANQRLFPATPVFSGLTATETSVNVAWTVIGTASNFVLNVTGTDLSRSVSLDGDQRNFVVTDLVATREYTVTLDAFSEDLKNWESAVTVINTSPAPVTDPKVISLSDSELNVTWSYTFPSANVRYLITRLPNDDETVNETNVHELELSENSFLDTGLTPGTPYSYEIVVSFSGIHSTPVETSGYTYPAVPVNLTTEDLQNDRVVLDWSVLPNYEVFRVVVTSDYDSFETRTHEVQESVFFLDKLRPGEEYMVRVDTKYRDLYSQGFAEITFETGCYPIGDDFSQPWKVAFALTFVYAVMITLVCFYFAYLILDRIPPKQEPIKPAKKYIITATPLDGTKWQKKYKEFEIRPH